MRPAMRRGVPLLALLTLCLALIPAGTWGQGTPIFTVHVNLDSWNQGFQSSRMAQCWNDPLVQQWRSTTLPQLSQQIQGVTGFDPVQILPYLAGEMAIMVEAAPSGGQGMPPMPQVALAIRQPGQIDNLLNLIGQNLPPDQVQMLQTLTLRADQNTVVFGNNPTLSQSLAGQMGGGPSGLGLQAPANSFLAGQFDMGAMMNVLASTGELPPDAQQGLTALGMSNISTIQLASGFRNQGLVGDVAVNFNGQRQGLMGLIGENRAFTTVPLMPMNTLSAGALSTPPMEEVLDWIGSMIQTMGGPTDYQNFQSGLAEFDQDLGMSLRNQVLPAFGQEIALAFGGATGMSADLGIMIEVDDQATIEGLIQRGLSAANDAMGGGMGAQPGQPGAQPTIQPVPMTEGSVSYNMIAVPGMPMQICYGFINGNLVIATSQTQMSGIAQAVNSGQNLTSAPGFQAVSGEMLSTAAAFGYSDSQRAMQTVSQAMMPIMMMAGDQMPPEMMQIMNQLPALSQYMGTRGSVLSAEPSRLWMHSYNTSGAELIVAAMVGSQMAMAGMQHMQQQMAPPPPQQQGWGQQPQQQPQQQQGWGQPQQQPQQQPATWGQPQQPQQQPQQPATWGQPMQ